MVERTDGGGGKRFRYALASALALGAVSCAGTPEAETARRPPLVEAVEARTGELPLEEIVHGVVRAENQVAVRPEIAAPVAEVLVRSGEAVERGQLLVRLRDDELDEQLRRAEADVRLAEASAAEARAGAAELEARAKRLQRLADDDLISPQELESITLQFEASRAGVLAAEAGVEQARAITNERRSALAKTRIRSPVTGNIGERRVEVGAMVAPDTVLFRVGRLDRVIVEITLTEAMLEHVRPGLPVALRARGGGEIEAVLTRVSPFLAEDSFTTVGEIDLDNADGRLRPGMFVGARILYGTSETATLVPASALWEDPRTEDRGVFVVDDAADLVLPATLPADNPEQARGVTFRRVEVRAEGRGVVGVGRVEAGEWVVIAGQHLLRREMEDGATGDHTAARIRPTSWDRITSLQSLQQEDLLQQFLDKQQRIARALGADIPTSEGVVREVLQADEDATGNR